MGGENAGSQTAGNLAVVAGLALVGAQIYQNNQIAQATMATSAYQQETELAIALMGENPSEALTKSVLDPGSLTPTEFSIVRSQLFWYLSMMNRNAAMEALGVFDSIWSKALLPLVASNIGGNPLMRELLMRQPDHSDWIVEMKAVALKTPENASFNAFKDLLNIQTKNQDKSR